MMNDTQRRAVQFGVPVLLLIVGLMGGWIGHNLVAPPGQSTTTTNYGVWTSTCAPYSQAKGGCTLQLSIIDKASGVSVANLFVGRAPDGEKLAITLPLNVLIMPGMAMTVGSDPVRNFHYDTCLNQGCITAINLDAKLMASLSAAKQAKIDFAMPTKDRKPLSFTFSIAGFSDAHNAVERDEAMRHSWWRRLWS
jgi:invasion protein IalB